MCVRFFDSAVVVLSQMLACFFQPIAAVLTITASSRSPTLRSLSFPSSMDFRNAAVSSRSFLISASASSRPIIARFRAASAVLRSNSLLCALMLRLLNGLVAFSKSSGLAPFESLPADIGEFLFNLSGVVVVSGELLLTRSGVAVDSGPRSAE